MKKRLITILSILSLMMIAAACGPTDKKKKESLVDTEELDFLEKNANKTLDELSGEDKKKAVGIVIKALKKQDWTLFFQPGMGGEARAMPVTVEMPGKRKSKTEEEWGTEGGPKGERPVEEEERKSPPPAPSDPAKQFTAFINTNAAKIVEKAGRLNPFDFVRALDFSTNVFTESKEAIAENSDEKAKKIVQDAQKESGGAGTMTKFDQARTIFVEATEQVPAYDTAGIPGAMRQIDNLLKELFKAIEAEEAGKGEQKVGPVGPGRKEERGGFEGEGREKPFGDKPSPAKRDLNKNW